MAYPDERLSGKVPPRLHLLLPLKIAIMEKKDYSGVCMHFDRLIGWNSGVRNLLAFATLTILMNACLPEPSPPPLDVPSPTPSTSLSPTPSPSANAIFQPIVPSLRAQTNIPLVLPRTLPTTDTDPPLYAIVETATASTYQILLAYTPDCTGGTACRLGMVRGMAPPEASLPAGEPVPLQNGQTGYFVASVCGANCSDATLTWEQNGYWYEVGMKAGDRTTLIEMANSAIAQGPP